MWQATVKKLDEKRVNAKRVFRVKFLSLLINHDKKGKHLDKIFIKGQIFHIGPVKMVRKGFVYTALGKYKLAE